MNLNFNAYEKENLQKKCEIGKKTCKCETFNVPLPMTTRRERAKGPKKPQVTVATTETKHVRNEVLFEIGKYCFDLSKLAFGGVVLVNVMHYSDENLGVLAAGVAFMAGFLILGGILVKRGTKK